MPLSLVQGCLHETLAIGLSLLGNLIHGSCCIKTLNFLQLCLKQTHYTHGTAFVFCLPLYDLNVMHVASFIIGLTL